VLSDIIRRLCSLCQRHGTACQIKTAHAVATSVGPCDCCLLTVNSCTCYLGVVHEELCAISNEAPAHIDGRCLARVSSVLLEGKSQHLTGTQVPAEQVRKAGEHSNVSAADKPSHMGQTA
jgi:hypothetical protein